MVCHVEGSSTWECHGCQLSASSQPKLPLLEPPESGVPQCRAGTALCLAWQCSPAPLAHFGCHLLCHLHHIATVEGASTFKHSITCTCVTCTCTTALHVHAPQRYMCLKKRPSALSRTHKAGVQHNSAYACPAMKSRQTKAQMHASCTKLLLCQLCCAVLCCAVLRCAVVWCGVV